MTARPLQICETLLRDAHQSLLATRMRTEDMLPVAEALDKVGYWSVEVWGGATFDSAMRFLNEDPWERLRMLRRALPRTRFQMLLRGQNLVGYKHYPDDIAERFIVQARRNGVDVFRIFDALNDTRNMSFAMRIAKREGGHVQAAISYTISPVHDIPGFVALGRELAELGADSIAIKDMAGLLTPYAAFELVSALKREVGLPIQLHTHYTSGMGTATLLKAIEAGVDVVDTAISSMSMSTSQPPTETVVAILKGTERDTGLDLSVLADIARKEGEIRKRYSAFEAGVAAVDVNVLQFQVPGGMLSNLLSQLRQQGAADRYYEVLEEIPRVRKDMGYPPLVTPSSQIVGTQATLNVVLGERYKVVPEEVKQYVRGYYGKPPAPIDPELQRKAIGTEQPITCRPADMLDPGMEDARREIGALARCEEDVLSYALFPQVARPFLERRAKGLGGKEEIAAAIALALFAQQEAKARHRVTAPAGPQVSAWTISGRPAAGMRWLR
ncbi:MAG: pyruvate carboxylase subunit B [Thermoanaerobaculaceae bacterium]|nr:pyruvate carboxylase subunit B [Thermoanaerobaculaceae bacterium]MDI9623099.1 pyruvate carboxylase subunit B [Acidobacteriota bacterium]NLH11390.1 pyruvate carboxylase subunit B [Holophagae bacterium]HPW55414.1 pyruvate carboxylase subunit B [Thermoanaerobaculaceae bacterium]